MSINPLPYNNNTCLARPSPPSPRPQRVWTSLNNTPNPSPLPLRPPMSLHGEHTSVRVTHSPGGKTTLNLYGAEEPQEHCVSPCQVGVILVDIARPHPVRWGHRVFGSVRLSVSFCRSLFVGNLYQYLYHLRQMISLSLTSITP